MTELKRSAREEELAAKAAKYLPAGTLGNLTDDVILADGRGSRVHDVSGHEYIDYLLGSGPMLVGHAHPEVVAAVREQLERGSTFFANNEQAILLAEEIAKAMPCAEQVRFCSTGTEATLYAMRAARAFRRRERILKFEGGFHGMNDYALMSMTPTTPVPFPTAVSNSAGIPRAVAESMLIAPFNDLETTTALIERHRDELAGVIVEPFQRVLPPKPGFLEGLREATAQYGIPLIFDEVVTSFRFAYGGAQEFYGVTPDLCALGKAVGGGFPLTAVAGREEIMAHFDASRVAPHPERQPGRDGGRPRDGPDPQAGRYVRADARDRQPAQAGAPAKLRCRAGARPRRWRGGAVRRLLHRGGDQRLPLDAARRQGQALPLRSSPPRARRLPRRKQVLPVDRA
jgi:glutamate-1-semialdehyde 2,1-aminomutase